MLQTTVLLLPVTSRDCRCLLCQHQVPAGFCYCAECYLYLCDEAPDFELPLTDDAFDHMRGEWLADEEAQRQYAEWSASVADQPLGVPCPGSSFVPF